MFEADAIKRIVDQQVRLIPEDHTVAVIAITNKEGTKIVTAVRKGDWQVGGYIQHNKLEGMAYGAEVMWSK